MRAVVVISFLLFQPFLSLAAESVRGPASVEMQNMGVAGEDEPGHVEMRAGRITGLASSVYSFSLGTRGLNSSTLELPEALFEFHDGGDPAWKLLLGGLSSKGDPGFSFQWMTEVGLTNDCPLCQTSEAQIYVNAGVGGAFEANFGKVFGLAGFETFAWIEDGNQSLGVPVIAVGAEANFGPVSAELTSSIAEARSKTKRESELRLEGEIADGISLVSQLSYRTITGEDDESKAFLGLNFAF